MRRVCLLFAALVLVACGPDESEGPSPSVRADLETLHVLIDRDPAAEPLELVERRIDDERPVHAAQVLSRTGVPAAERQVTLVRDARVTTPEGRRFQRRLREAYQARVDALDAYRVLLEGGVAADQFEVLGALREVRQAEEGLYTVVSEMDDLVQAGAQPSAPPDEDALEPTEGAAVDGPAPAP